MKKTLYIAILSLLLVASVSGIAFLMYPLDGESGSNTVFTAVANTIAPEEPTGSASAEDTGGENTRFETTTGGNASTGGGTHTYTPQSDTAIPSDTKALYLILDDGGHTLEDLRAFMGFDGVFTLAVLPRLEYSQEAARMAVALGHELILHQPMEPLGETDPGPGAIYTWDSPFRVRAVLRRNLAMFPDAIGVNNHMGSKATSDSAVMDTVVGVLAHRNLFFLDSRTIHTSIAEAAAGRAGLPALRRDVFLDNVRTAEAINAQIDEALAIAESRGSAVMIGHVTSHELARVLIDRYDEIIAAGYQFLPISHLAARKAQRIAHEDPRD